MKANFLAIAVQDNPAFASIHFLIPFSWHVYKSHIDWWFQKILLDSSNQSTRARGTNGRCSLLQLEFFGSSHVSYKKKKTCNQSPYRGHKQSWAHFSGLTEFGSINNDGDHVLEKSLVLLMS